MKWNNKAVSKCEKTKYEMYLTRWVFVIREDNQVIASKYLSEDSKTGASVDKLKSSLNKKASGIEKLSSFDLTDTMKCTVRSVKKNYTVSCNTTK